MKTDKELLQLAAKAAGVNGEYRSACVESYNADIFGIAPKGFSITSFWSPLTNEGDAFRLAVYLDMDVCLSPRDKEVTAFTLIYGAVSSCTEPYGNDKHAATRRAIVRAAAAIGEDME